jgi:hypothetical protein
MIFTSSLFRRISDNDSDTSSRKGVELTQPVRFYRRLEDGFPGIIRLVTVIQVAEGN